MKLQLHFRKSMYRYMDFQEIYKVARTIDISNHNNNTT